jgi:hypothetical protein
VEADQRTVIEQAFERTFRTPKTVKFRIFERLSLLSSSWINKTLLRYFESHQKGLLGGREGLM